MLTKRKTGYSKYNINKIILSIYVFFVPLSVCTIIFPNISDYLNFLLFVSIICVGLIFKSKIFKFDKFVVILIFVPIFLSLISAFINLYQNDIKYNEYFTQNMPLRLINCSIFFVFFLFTLCFLYLFPDNSFFLKSYGWGIFCILGILGIWQIFNIFFGIWMPELQTKSHIHSIADRNLIGNFFRVTSFASEPSYLAPFMIDGILIFVFFRKHVLSLIFIVILFFSMSLGGYVNLVIVLLFWLFLSKNYTRLSYILGIILVLVSAIILFHDKMGFIFEIVSNREELSSNFKITDTPRTEMIVYPWTYLFENNIITILFGNGPSSMKYLSTTKTLATGNNYHVTSNNIFTDIGFEEGIIGVMGAVIFFIFLYRLFILNTHTKDIYIGRCSLFGKLFVIHLLVSSLYRADFISSRFWTVILIIYTLKTMIKTNTVKT